MTSILNRFLPYLKEISFPSNNNEQWQVKGRLEKFSNKTYKFDVRDMITASNGIAQKEGSFKTKADKFVFETTKYWLVFDIEEFLNYLIERQVKVIRLEEMMNNLFFVWKIRK
jgi:hypothetical protein